MVETVLDVIRKKLGTNYHWPGNVRELAQCVRKIIIKRDYQGEIAAATTDTKSALLAGIEAGTLDAETRLNAYCKLLYQRL